MIQVLNKVLVVGIIAAIIVVSASSYFYFNSDLDVFDFAQSESIVGKPIVPEGFTTFESEVLSISISHPEEWIAKPTERVDSPAVIFSSTNDLLTDYLNVPSFSISSVPKDNFTNFDGFLDNVRNGVNQNKSVKQTTHDVYDGSISGQDALISEIEQEFLNYKTRSMTYILEMDDRVYVIGYTAPVSEYESNLHIAEEMFSSFRFI